MNLAINIISFNRTLHLSTPLPTGVVAMNPFQNAATRKLSEQFYTKYYSDSNTRKLIVGINPGRFGSGLTGVPFTDPIRLQSACGIVNSFPQKQELSSLFIYQLIDAMDGIEKFYQQFYISSVCALGFTKEEKNINYYDIPLLQKAVEPFIAEKLKHQVTWNIDVETIYCMGEGKNYAYLSALNKKYNFFKTIIPLPHPRFIMQYKRKQADAYIELYRKNLTQKW